MKTRKFSIFGQDIVISKRLFGVGKEDNYYGLMRTYGDDYKAFSRLDAYSGKVFSCINLIGEACGGYEPIISRGETALETHPFLELLARPGGMKDKAVPISQFDLFFATIAFILLQGDCYWYFANGEISNKPRTITILRADKVGKTFDENGEISGYFVKNNGVEVPITVEEMLPFIGFNPKDAYKGISTVDAAADFIETEEYSAKFTKLFFKNNGGLSGLLQVNGEISKQAFKKFVRAWRSKYEGVDSAGKLAIIRDSDASFTKVGLGLNELDMSALRNMSESDLYQMFRVPAELLGKITAGSGLGRGNMETVEYIFAKYNINKKLERFDSMLQFALDRYYGPGLTLSHKNIIPEDKEFALKEQEAAVRKWLTPNEVRKIKGLAPVEGGDILTVPMNEIPINDISAPAEPATKGIVIKRRRVIATVVEKKEDINPEQKEAFRVRLMRNQLAYERRYRKAFLPILTEQHKEALHNLETHASSLTKALDQKLFDDAAADAEMAKRMKPILVDLANQQGALAMVFAGDADGEFRMTPPLENYLADSTSKMAGNFNDETLTQLNKTLAEGIQDGESLGKLKKRVDAVYDQGQGYRSLRLARTETLKASNTATKFAYKQTGYVTGKQWYANPGADAECEEMASRSAIALDEAFLNLGETLEFMDGDTEKTITIDYDTIEEPPLHPNCRCTILPVRDTKDYADSFVQMGELPPEVKKVAKPKTSKAELLKLQRANHKDKKYIKQLEAELGISDGSK